MHTKYFQNVYGLDADSKEDSEGFAESCERVNRLIQSELDSGIPSESIAVGGFSQGGALALHVALRSPNKLAACVALSAWVPLHADYPAALSAASSTLPILQVHVNRIDTN
jgi:predicted esterase